MSDAKPQATYVGHPAMRDYRVEYVGLYKRPGMDGVWSKRMELWRENGQDCGAWRWVPAEAVVPAVSRFKDFGAKS